MAKVTPSRGGSDLNRHRELISRLEESRGKMRKRGDNTNSRSYDQRSDQRRAEYERGLAEHRANQDRYRGDFEIVGGGNPGMAYSQVVTGYYNPETGATWSAPHSGYKPKEGTGWVKGYGPNTKVINDPRITIPESKMEERWSKEGKASPKETTEKTPTKDGKFEALLRSRMRKF